MLVLEIPVLLTLSVLSFPSVLVACHIMILNSTLTYQSLFAVEEMVREEFLAMASSSAVISLKLLCVGIF